MTCESVTKIVKVIIKSITFVIIKDLNFFVIDMQNDVVRLLIDD